MNKLLKAMKYSDLPEIVWRKPYSYKPHWPFGFDIYCDDDSIHIWLLHEKDAKHIVGCLNGAYNLGQANYKLDVSCETL